jgi:hypothetical protein
MLTPTITLLLEDLSSATHSFVHEMKAVNAYVTLREVVNEYCANPIYWHWHAIFHTSIYFE